MGKGKPAKATTAMWSLLITDKHQVCRPTNKLRSEVRREKIKHAVKFSSPVKLKNASLKLANCTTDYKSNCRWKLKQVRIKQSNRQAKAKNKNLSFIIVGGEREGVPWTWRRRHSRGRASSSTPPHRRRGRRSPFLEGSRFLAPRTRARRAKILARGWGMGSAGDMGDVAGSRRGRDLYRRPMGAAFAASGPRRFPEMPPLVCIFFPKSFC
jgi:hypothetical protein